MKLKNLFSAGVLVATLLVGSSAFAYVTHDQAALGGIPSGASMDYVRSIYGNPDRAVPESYGGKYTPYLYYYGTGVMIYDSGVGRANVITVTANNGWATPAGVTVGMSEMVLNDVYGPANSVDYHNGTTIYSYQPAPHGGPAILSFGVENGIIVSISAGFGG